MSDELPVKAGHALDSAHMVQVVFAPGSIYEAFKEWVVSRGLELTPPMRFTDDEFETPSQFVTLTEKAIAEVWPDSPVSKLGQVDE
jgi:hypothetical protein